MKYELIVKEIESGEVVCRRECDCIIGAVASGCGEEINANAVTHLSAPVVTILGGLAAATGTIAEVKQVLYEDFCKTFETGISEEDFNEFIDALSRNGFTKDEGETVKKTFEEVSE